MILVMTENDCHFAPDLSQVEELDVKAWIDAPEVTAKNDYAIMFIQGSMAWIRAQMFGGVQFSKATLIMRMERGEEEARQSPDLETPDDQQD